MQINQNFLTTDSKLPLYQQATYPVPPTTYTVQTSQGEVQTKLDAGIWQSVQDRKFNVSNAGYLRPGVRRDEREKWGVYATNDSPFLHQYVIAKVTGLMPADNVDHIYNKLDNRFNSLRLVTAAINSANGSGLRSGEPCVHKCRNVFKVEVGIDGCTYYFGTYANKAAANKAAQVALHYRAVLHAERSAWIMGRHLARCANADAITHIAAGWVGTWAKDTTASKAFEFYFETADYTEPATPCVPVEQLRKLCKSATVDGKQEAAIATAKMLACFAERQVLVAHIAAALVAA